MPINNDYILVFKNYIFGIEFNRNLECLSEEMKKFKTIFSCSII